MSTTIPRGAPHALTPISTSRLRLCKPFCGASSFGHVVGSQKLRARRSSNSGSVAVATPVDTQHAPRQNGTHRQSTPSAGQAAGPGAPGKRIVVVGGGWAGKASVSYAQNTHTPVQPICYWLTTQFSSGWVLVPEQL